MATWRIYDDLRATYQSPRAAGGAVQACGRPVSDKIQFNDILAWTAINADPGDIIATSKGCYHFTSAPGLH